MNRWEVVARQHRMAKALGVSVGEIRCVLGRETSIRILAGIKRGMVVCSILLDRIPSFLVNSPWIPRDRSVDPSLGA